jgi:hypothetical protein
MDPVKEVIDRSLSVCCPSFANVDATYTKARAKRKARIDDGLSCEFRIIRRLFDTHSCFHHEKLVIHNLNCLTSRSISSDILLIESADAEISSIAVSCSAVEVEIICARSLERTAM